MLDAPAIFGGKYRVERRIDLGGLGEAFLAVQTGPAGQSRQVVVKTLPDLAHHRALADPFFQEVRWAGLLQHPNIVRQHDFGEQDGLRYVVAEHLDGLSLQQVLREAVRVRRRLTAAFAAAVGSQLCAALSHLHSLCDAQGAPLKLIHRDVSPHNILVCSDGTARLQDFGIARFIDPDSTAREDVRGRPTYLSPEHCGVSPLDSRSDLFCLGIVLWELAILRKLLRGSTRAELAHQVCHVAAPPLRTLDQEIPKELAEIVERSLQLDPARRFQTAAEMGSALGALLGRSGIDAREEIRREVARARAPEQAEPSNLEPVASEAGGPALVLTPDPSVPQQPVPSPAETSPTALALQAEDSALIETSRRRAWSLLLKLALAVAALAVAVGIALVVLNRQPVAPVAAPRSFTEDLESVALELSSEPSGARILLDGADTGKTTPASLTVATGKDHAVELRHPDCLPFTEQVFAAPHQPMKLAAVLKFGGSVQVDSDSIGAHVEIDGKPAFDTPGRSAPLPPGKHLLVVQAPGSITLSRELELKPRDAVEWNVKLEPGGLVKVGSVPPGAAVEVDDKPTGQVTPAEIYLRLGKRHTVRLTLEGHVTATRKLPELTAKNAPMVLELTLADARRADLKTRIASLEKLVADRERKLKKLHTQESFLVSDVSKEQALEKRIEELTSELEEAQADLGSLREELDKADAVEPAKQRNPLSDLPVRR